MAIPQDMSLLNPSQIVQLSESSGSFLVKVTKKVPGRSSSAFLESASISSWEKQVEFARMREEDDQSCLRKSSFINSIIGSSGT